MQKHKCKNVYTRRGWAKTFGFANRRYAYMYICYTKLLYISCDNIRMGSPIKLKQKLSPKAAAAKKLRDKAAAMTPKRRARKAENQRIGQRSDSDLHHSSSGLKRVSIKNNRGNFGNGTKTE